MTSVSPVPAALTLLRLLPARLPGKRRLAQALMNAFLPEGPADIETGGITFRVPSVREPVAVGLIADGSYETCLCTALETVLRKDSVFFDVGANIGVFSLFAAHCWCPEGRVIGFEASPQIYDYLQHNGSTQPRPGLTLLNRAVTASGGEHLTFYNAPAAKFGMGSLANRFGTPGVDVLTASLDQVAAEQGIDRVDVIKVDVEGFELGVFQGAQKILAQSQPPLIFFEFNDWAEERGDTRAGDAQRYLHSLGYVTVPLEDWNRGDRTPHAPVTVGGVDLVAFKPAAR